MAVTATNRPVAARPRKLTEHMELARAWIMNA